MADLSERSEVPVLGEPEEGSSADAGPSSLTMDERKAKMEQLRLKMVRVCAVQPSEVSDVVLRPLLLGFPLPRTSRVCLHVGHAYFSARRRRRTASHLSPRTRL
jgi:hypothetical protein